jgi:hypothetical protein
MESRRAIKNAETRTIRETATDCDWNLEVTVRIELTKYGFANRPVSHSGTSPHNEKIKLSIVGLGCQ